MRIAGSAIRCSIFLALLPLAHVKAQSSRAALASTGSSAVAPSALREFRIDAGHSEIGFSIGFLGRPVRGRFDDVRGTLVYAAGNLPSSAITVIVATSSISTGSKHRDEHLKSSDFFDVARYPTMMFQSRSIRAGASKGTFVITGPLTIHGVTRDVAIPFRETTAPIEDPHGSTLLVFSGALRISHADFGIVGGSKYNDWFDDLRRATMADSVDLTLDVTAWAPDYARTHSYDAAVARITQSGAAQTAAKMRALNAQYPDTLKDAEWELDQIGRLLLQRGRNADALELFKLNAELFPRSSGAHASLARYYEVAGDRSSARVSADRALSIDSLDPRALELRRRLR